MSARSYILLLILLLVPEAQAVSNPIDFVHNTARAKFDVDGVAKSTFSNTASTRINWPARFEFGDSVERHAFPGETVVISHTLKNRDRVASLIQIEPNDQDARGADWKLYLDVNENGAIDSTDRPLEVLSELLLPAQSNQSILIWIRVPDDTPPRNALRITLGAHSESGWEQVVTDTIRIHLERIPLLQKTITSSDSDHREGRINFRLELTRANIEALRPFHTRIDGQSQSGFLFIDELPLGTQLNSLTATNGATPVFNSGTGDIDNWQTSLGDEKNPPSTAGIFIPSLPTLNQSISFDLSLNFNPESLFELTNQGRFIYFDGQFALTNQVKATLHPRIARLKFVADPSMSETLDYSTIGRPLYLLANASQCNLNRFERESIEAIVSTPLSQDSEKAILLETGPNTGIFASTTPLNTATRIDSEMTPFDGTLVASEGESALATIYECQTGTPITTRIELDSPGVLFDTGTNQPIPGARVSILSTTTVSTSTSELGTPSASSVQTVTDEKGRIHLAVPLAGDYVVTVSPPEGYTWPVPESHESLAALKGERRIRDSASFGKTFRMLRSGQAVNFDIPVLAIGSGPVFLNMSTDRESVQRGELVTYEISMKNASPIDATSIQIENTPPPGFVPVPETLTIQSSYNREIETSNTERNGEQFLISVPSILSEEILTLSYRVRVTAIAPSGRQISTALVRYQSSGDNNSSNPASAAIEVLQGTLTSNHSLSGYVFADHNRNGQLDRDEAGIPNVMLYMENGRQIRTDTHGRFHLSDIQHDTHLLRLDPNTLPDQWRPGPGDSRYLLHGSARLLQGFPGEHWVANFPLQTDNTTSLEFKTEELNPDAPTNSNPAKYYSNSQSEIEQALNRPFTPNESRSVLADQGPGVRSIRDAQTRKPIPQSSTYGNSEQESPWIAQGPDRLKERLSTLDNTLEILDYQEDQLTPNSVSIRAKGRLGSQFILMLDQTPIGPEKVGVRVSSSDTEVELWEFTGIELEPGPHTIQWIQRDLFGNPRGTDKRSIVASGIPESLALENRSPSAPYGTDIRIAIKVLDANGNPTFRSATVTLDNDNLEWLIPDRDPATPGHQILVERGEREIAFRPRASTPKSEVVARLDDFIARLTHHYGTSKSPFILTGLASIQTDENALFNRQSDPPNPMLPPIGNQERVAFYSEGAFSESLSLALSYDSNRGDGNDFRYSDSNKNSYPVFGDDSIDGYGVASDNPWYGRVDWNTHFAEWGEFSTETGTHSSRQITRYRRNVNGARIHSEIGNFNVSAWTAQIGNLLARVELPGDGTSGPYAIGTAPVNRGSESVSLLVRDYTSSQNLISETPLIRNVDYQIDYESGEIYLSEPLASFDRDTNPQSLLVNFENEIEPNEDWARGSEATWSQNGFELGVANILESPLTGSELWGAFMTLPTSESTELSLEWGYSQTDIPEQIEGEAWRAKWGWQLGRFSGKLHALQSDEAFQNPSAAIASGQEEISFQGEYKLGNQARWSTKAIRSKRSDTIRQGWETGLQSELGGKSSWGTLYREVDFERQSEEGSTSTKSSLVGMQLRSRADFWRPTNVSLTALQDTSDSDARATRLKIDQSLPGDYKAYVRHDWNSTPDTPFDLEESRVSHSIIWGLERQLGSGGRVYHELRGNDSLESGDMERAIGGSRRWKTSSDSTYAARFESISPNENTSKSKSMAASFSFDSPNDLNWKGNARLEFRNQQDNRRWLLQSGAGRRVNSQVTLFGRGILLQEEPKSNESLSQANERWRLLAGIAIRPNADSPWTSLARHEIINRDGGSSRTATSILDVQYEGRITSFDIHYARMRNRDTDTPGLTYIDHGEMGGMSFRIGLTDQFDLGVRGYALSASTYDQLKFSYGPEWGWRPHSHMRIVVRYNLSGFEDHAFGSPIANQKGFVLEANLAFDESIIAWALDTKGAQP